MSPTSRRPFVLTAAAAAVVVAAAFVFRGAAQADGTSCTAYVAGVDTSRGAVPQVVVSNLTSGEMTLDLKVVDPDGTTLIDRAGELVVPGLGTREFDLVGELRQGLTRREKHFQGVVSVEVTGGTPFSSETAVVHVTQYYGTRKRPRAGYVIRPLFRTNP